MVLVLTFSKRLAFFQVLRDWRMDDFILTPWSSPWLVSNRIKTLKKQSNNGNKRCSYLSSRRRRSWQIQSHLHSDQVRHPPLPSHLRVFPSRDWQKYSSVLNREAFVQLNPRTVLPEVTIPPNVTPGHDVQTVIIDTSRKFSFTRVFRSWSLDHSCIVFAWGW